MQLKKSNWMAVILMYALLLTCVPRAVLAVVPVATSFSVTASTVGNKAITLQGSDADGTALTFALLSQPTHGAISGFSASTGALIYTPAFGYSGADSFTFKVTSGGQDSSAATVSITVAADKTRIIDYVTDAGGAGQVGKVTFILTSTATTGGGLISPASSVTAQTDATGKYDLTIIPSANLNPKTYYQVYFQTNYSDRRLLGVYDIPVSATPIALQTYRVTDTNLANRFTFADKASVDAVQTANANAVFQSLVPTGAQDGQIFAYDATTQRLKTSPIRETPTRIQLDKPVANLTADTATVTGNQNVGGNVTANSFTGNGATLTGVVGTGPGGTDSEGSVSIIANKNGANGSSVIEGLVGPSGSRVSVFRSDANGFDLLKGLPRSTVAGLPAAGNAGRRYKTLDDFRGEMVDNGSQWVEVGGRAHDVRNFGARPGATAAENVTAINLALAALSSTGGGVLEIPRDRFSDNYNVNAAIPLPDNVKIIGNAKITQTANNTSIFTVNNKSNIRIEGMDFVGVGTDYQEIISDPAQAINASQIVNGLYVHNCSFTNFGNAAVKAKGSKIKLTNLTIVGVGLAELTPITSGANYGIVIESNTTDAYIAGCTISETAQGIATGQNINSVRIIGNHIFNIRGQHAIYCGGGGNKKILILGNTIEGTRLIGIKVQVDDTATAHCYNVTVVGNTVEKAGGAAINITSGLATGAYKIYNATVNANAIFDDCPDDGINLMNVIGGVVAGNGLYQIDREGLSFTNCRNILGIGNYIFEAANSGIRVYEISGTTSDLNFISNIIYNPTTANSGTSTGHAGIRISGGSKINYLGNVITDTQSKMEYGIFREAGSQANDFMNDNIVIGATQWSVRLQAGTALSEIRNNFLPGGIQNNPTTGQRGSSGRIWYGTAAPTTGSWVVGDILYNMTPTAGGNIGWVCVAGGTPGTWKSFGVIAS